MGHIRLGQIPKTQSWNEVLDLLDCKASSSEIANAAFKAIRSGLKTGADDPGLIEAFYLITQITQAARSPNFTQSLRMLGLDIADNPTLLDLSTAFTEALDNHLAQSPNRTDLSEIAHRVAIDSLMNMAAENSMDLFQSQTIDVQKSLKQYSTHKGFSYFSRQFFANLFNRYIQYYLSRAVPLYTGPGKKFESLGKTEAFNKALSLHCYQTALIVEEFSGGWYGKQNFRGGITREKASGFMAYAMKKLYNDFSSGGPLRDE